LTLTPQVIGHTNYAIGAVGFPTPGGPASNCVFHEGPVTDQELIFSALRQVGLIVAEHLESRSCDADEAITQLIAVLDTPELAVAMNRLGRGYGMRLVK
jgi:hypothetical protein